MVLEYQFFNRLFRDSYPYLSIRNETFVANHQPFYFTYSHSSFLFDLFKNFCNSSLVLSRLLIFNGYSFQFVPSIEIQFFSYRKIKYLGIFCFLSDFSIEV